jgi:hypothetical protein
MGDTEVTTIPQSIQSYYTTYAAFPTVGVKTGSLAYATDTLMLYRWDGAAWQPITSAGVTSKLKTHTRENDAASGDVAYNGYGFNPTTLVILAQGNAGCSIGFGDLNLAEMCVFLQGSGTVIFWQSDAGKIIMLQRTSDSTGQSAVLKTLDADGFTLTWTRIGASAAGTDTLIVSAFK